MSSRIALAGSAGTGKTTLGSRLAADLDVPFIEEGMRERIEAGLDLHDFTKAQIAELMEELWSEQHAREEDAAHGFIADRSSFDFAAFWFHYELQFDREATERWMDKMCAAALRYDRVLLLPWGVLPIENDGVRSTNRWTQFRFQAILEGVLNRFAARGVVLRIPGTDDFEQRVRFVHQYLPA